MEISNDYMVLLFNAQHQYRRNWLGSGTDQKVYNLKYQGKTFSEIQEQFKNCKIYVYNKTKNMDVLIYDKNGNVLSRFGSNYQLSEFEVLIEPIDTSVKYFVWFGKKLQ